MAWPATHICCLVSLAAVVYAVLASATPLDAAPIFGRSLLGFPPYERGPQYRYALTKTELENGISYLPAAERLRIAFDKLIQGKNITLTTVGASIMAGQGTDHGPALAKYIFNWLADTYPGQVTTTNGAVAGTTSSYLSVCHNIHVPSDVDIVIVDYSISDWFRPPGPPFHNDVRRSFERLIRKLLNYPNQPAVILLHAYAWNVAVPFEGAYWSNAEREFGEFERFYHLPSVSTKTCCYHNMRQGKEGFNTTPRAVRTNENFGKHFYFDNLHPDESSGCRLMAELIFHLFTKVDQGVRDRPVTNSERQRAHGHIPDPMIAGNFESASTRCFIASAFTSSVQSSNGWDWINESKTERPKWGYISNVPGSEIRLKVDTRTTSRVDDQIKHETALVQLAHLKSYEGMGEASVTCEGGCTCTESLLQGHHEPHTSLMFQHDLHASLAEDCIIVIKVLSTTKSTGNKVKLMGIIVSEVAGGGRPIDNPLAIEYVGDIAMRAKDGKFLATNHI